MTDPKLLPLPLPKGDVAGGGLDWTDEEMQDYARDNVAHHTEALRGQREFQAALIKELLPYQDEAVASRAEIETLRAEVVALKTDLHEYRDAALRLAEALRDIESRPWNGVRPIQIAARAALRDNDKEVGNG